MPLQARHRIKKVKTHKTKAKAKIQIQIQIQIKIKTKTKTKTKTKHLSIWTKRKNTWCFPSFPNTFSAERLSEPTFITIFITAFFKRETALRSTFRVHFRRFDNDRNAWNRQNSDGAWSDSRIARRNRFQRTILACWMSGNSISRSTGWKSLRRTRRFRCCWTSSLINTSWLRRPQMWETLGCDWLDRCWMIISRDRSEVRSNKAKREL